MKALIKKMPLFNLLNKQRHNVIRDVSLIRTYYYDYMRFKKYYTNNALTKNDKKSIESWLLQDKHRIEKGLSLPEPRYNFGEAVIKRLVNNLQKYKEEFGKDQVYFIAVGSIKAYEDFHFKNKMKVKESIINDIKKIEKEDFDNDICSTVGVYPTRTIENTSQFFEDFVTSRSSCRNFNTEKVIEPEIFDSVIKMTVKTPSVCNRQHWKSHIFTGDKKSAILSLQNGNTGFTDNIPYLAVITSDLRSFYMPSERTQAFTDGGMFAMSFIYALHSFGISSCALNWCVTSDLNESIYKYTNIQKHESVVMLIAFGYANECSNNAKSPRLDFNNFIEHDC